MSCSTACDSLGLSTATCGRLMRCFITADWYKLSRGRPGRRSVTLTEPHTHRGDGPYWVCASSPRPCHGTGCNNHASAAVLITHSVVPHPPPCLFSFLLSLETGGWADKAAHVLPAIQIWRQTPFVSTIKQAQLTPFHYKHTHIFVFFGFL